MWSGDWDEAEDEASEALEIPDAHAEAVARRVMGLIHARRGRPDAREHLNAAADLAEASLSLQHLDPAMTALAEYAWLSGGGDAETLSRIDRVLELGSSTGPPWPSDALGFWACLLGLIEELPAGLNPVYRNIVDGGWQEGADWWRSRGFPYEEGLGLMHGDDDARTRALRIFEGLGADAAAARVRRDLLERGVRVSRGSSRFTRQHVAGLTGRQAEVLGLIAGGLTNGEIADRLFVSVRTVENHVAALLMKLDASNRQQAVDIARRRGILDS